MDKPESISIPSIVLLYVQLVKGLTCSYILQIRCWIQIEDLYLDQAGNKIVNTKKL